MAAHRTRVSRLSRSSTWLIRWAFAGSAMTDPVTEAPARTAAQLSPPRLPMPAELQIILVLSASPSWEVPAAVHAPWHALHCLLTECQRQPPSQRRRRGQQLASTSSPACQMAPPVNCVRPPRDVLSWKKSLLPTSSIPSPSLLLTTQRLLAVGPGSTVLFLLRQSTGLTE